jgi:mono/diheme cytochrome c family protein
VSGADLYRLNCQACHRDEGTGAPPDVKSLLDLVRGSSLELVRRQLSGNGKTANPAAAQALAAAARQALHVRIREGGQRMPPFAHLDRADIDVLSAYLSLLARVPDLPPQSTIRASWARLGEHVAKGTCHICHDAVGPRPDADAMLRGAVPPLSVLLAENSQASFIRKASEGATVPMGRPSFHYRGRMPVFYYLRDQELAAAYDFLVAYPPRAAGATHQR